MKELCLKRERGSSPPHTPYRNTSKEGFEVSERGLRCFSATSRRFPLAFRLSFPYKCPMGDAQSGSIRPRTSSSAKAKNSVYVCKLLEKANGLTVDIKKSRHVINNKQTNFLAFINKALAQTACSCCHGCHL